MPVQALKLSDELQQVTAHQLHASRPHCHLTGF